MFLDQKQSELVGNCMMEENGFRDLFSLPTFLFTLHVIRSPRYFSSLTLSFCQTDSLQRTTTKNTLGTGIAPFMRQNLHVTQISSRQRRIVCKNMKSCLSKILPTKYSFRNLRMNVYTHKQNWVLNNLQRLICHKTQTTEQISPERRQVSYKFLL